MFPTPYIPPIPEDRKSINANRRGSLTYALFGGWCITGTNAIMIALIPSAIRDITETYSSGNSLEATLATGLGIFAIALFQGMSILGAYATKDMIEDEEKDIKIKKEYRDAINNKNTNLVYKLEEEQPYLIKWGERFIKNYNTIKPKQLSIPYENTI